MSYVQRRISKKVVAGKSQIIFHVVISRGVKLRYKTGICIEPEFWSEKTNDIRAVTKASKYPPAVLRKIRGYASEMDKLEDCILFLIGEFPKLVGNKITVKENDKADSVEKYWLEIALDCVSGMDRSEWNREYVEKSVEARIYTAPLPEAEKPASVYELGLRFLNKRGLCQRRVDSYNVMFRVMCRYEIFRSMTTGIEWKWDLHATTTNDIVDFIDYIGSEYEYQDKYKDIFALSMAMYPVECTPKHKCARIRERGGNYICCMYKKLKAFWHWMQKNGLATIDPFVGVEVNPEIYGTPFYMTMEERNRVAEHDLSQSPPLELQRDIFIFQCLTGCRMGDLYALTWDNIVRNVLVYTPHKTKDEHSPVTARVPLSARARQLVERYKGVDPKGRLFPFVSKAAYNKAIKNVLKECGVNRMVNVRNSLTGENEMRPIWEVASSHMARRTFVGNAYKLVKDQNIVSKMSGHAEGSRAFCRYRDIDDDTLTEVINAMQ
mgnify:FL=1